MVIGPLTGPAPETASGTTRDLVAHDAIKTVDGPSGDPKRLAQQHRTEDVQFVNLFEGVGLDLDRAARRDG